MVLASLLQRQNSPQEARKIVACGRPNNAKLAVASADSSAANQSARTCPQTVVRFAAYMARSASASNSSGEPRASDPNATPALSDRTTSPPGTVNGLAIAM